MAMCELPLVEMAETVQVHFALGGEGPNGLEKRSQMKSVRGVLHGRLWIRVHGMPDCASDPPPRGGPDA